MAKQSSRLRLWFLALPGILIFAGLPWIPTDSGYLRQHAQYQLLQRLTSGWKKKPWLSNKKARVQVRCNRGACPPRFVQHLKNSKLFRPTRSPSKLDPTYRLDLEWTQSSSFTASLRSRLVSTRTGKVLRQKESQQPLIRWTAIVPPLAAVYLVLLTRKILLSLFLSLFVGVTLLHNFNPALGLYHMGKTYLWEKAIYQEFSLNIILFVLCLIGMINVCTRSGGVMGLIQGLVRFAKTPRSSRLVTALLGLVIFFDDYANSITVGNTMRPLTDRYRVSREKLAYLIDSTAAPAN